MARLPPRRKGRLEHHRRHGERGGVPMPQRHHRRHDPADLRKDQPSPARQDSAEGQPGSGAGEGCPTSGCCAASLASIEHMPMGPMGSLAPRTFAAAPSPSPRMSPRPQREGPQHRPTGDAADAAHSGGKHPPCPAAVGCGPPPRPPATTTGSPPASEKPKGAPSGPLSTAVRCRRPPDSHARGRRAPATGSGAHTAEAARLYGRQPR
jgi:hypothetical protein